MQKIIILDTMCILENMLDLLMLLRRSASDAKYIVEDAHTNEPIVHSTCNSTIIFHMTRVLNSLDCL
jgi:hypothetical protein